jgi:hypothetical protein
MAFTYSNRQLQQMTLLFDQCLNRVKKIQDTRLNGRNLDRIRYTLMHISLNELESDLLTLRRVVLHETWRASVTQPVNQP